MLRRTITPRPDWEKIVESQGILYHTTDDGKYWDESAYYEFTSREVDELEKATNDVHALCLEAVQHVIDKGRYEELFIPDFAIPLIESSWNNETAAIFGRFDFQFDGKGPPKMLEYNADTPTSLPEAAIAQWYWMEEQCKGADQFNSIHDKLIAKWTELKEYLHASPLYFTGVADREDYMNITYMRETALQAGLETKEIEISDIGWHNKENVFLDQEMYTMENIFKLYPWEWLLNEDFGKNIALCFDKTFWIEPPWKLILSNKGILPILWELNKGHPNLLPTFRTQEECSAVCNSFVQKPIYSREGANVTLMNGGEKVVETSGCYGEEGFVYQENAFIPNYGGNYPVLGSWVIDGVSAGVGIRESNSQITNNTSRFIPHIFR